MMKMKKMNFNKRIINNIIKYKNFYYSNNYINVYNFIK